MLSITPHMKIYLGISPLDMRKGIDSIVAICSENFSIDPMTGALFAFINRGKTLLRLLMYDSQGYWICTKRMSKGRFGWWPKSENEVVTLEAHKLLILIRGGDPSKVRFPDDWKKISP